MVVDASAVAWCQVQLLKGRRSGQGPTNRSGLGGAWNTKGARKGARRLGRGSRVIDRVGSAVIIRWRDVRHFAVLPKKGSGSSCAMALAHCLAEPVNPPRQALVVAREHAEVRC